jgi:low temperature requirement protein LtrA
VTGETVTAFILAYAATKFILLLMYGRAFKQFPEYRALTGHYAALYLLIGLMWVAIALIAPSNYWLWGVAIAVDVFAPLIIRGSHQLRGRPQPDHPPLKHHYMLHRFGEITIIVLGEFFIKLITSSSGLELQSFNYYMVACLLLISVSMWWLYFDHTDHTHLDREQTRPAVWIYSHYFLLSAITAYGVVGTKVFAAVPGEILSQEKRLLLSFALAMAVLALGIIDWATPEENGRLSRRPTLNIRIVAALVLLLLAPLGGQINVGWLVTLVTLVLVAQVSIDIWQRLRNQTVEETAAASSQ